MLLVTINIKTIFINKIYQINNNSNSNNNNSNNNMLNPRLKHKEFNNIIILFKFHHKRKETNKIYQINLTIITIIIVLL